jgi:hypothetical protein
MKYCLKMDTLDVVNLKQMLYWYRFAIFWEAIYIEVEDQVKEKLFPLSETEKNCSR